jgi:hypothetical protein
MKTIPTNVEIIEDRDALRNERIREEIGKEVAAVSHTGPECIVASNFDRWETKATPADRQT